MNNKDKIILSALVICIGTIHKLWQITEKLQKYIKGGKA